MVPRLKRDVAELQQRAIASLILAIELFNRPNDLGRADTVLILLHHAFEMLLKAVIKERTGTVQAADGRRTLKFLQCLGACVGN